MSKLSAGQANVGRFCLHPEGWTLELLGSVEVASSSRWGGGDEMAAVGESTLVFAELAVFRQEMAAWSCYETSACRHLFV